MTGTPAPVSDPSTVYALFVGIIDQQSTKRIVDALTLATAPGMASRVYLGFQSTGGVVGDGIFLYNLFKSFPMDLTIYNMGQVSSIAAIAFLGVKKRKVSTHASFMVHRCTNAVGQPATASRLKLLAESLGLDDERSEAILRKHLNLTDAQWAIHSRDDLFFSAEDALAADVVRDAGAEVVERVVGQDRERQHRGPQAEAIAGPGVGPRREAGEVAGVACHRSTPLMRRTSTRLGQRRAHQPRERFAARRVFAGFASPRPSTVMA